MACSLLFQQKQLFAGVMHFMVTTEEHYGSSYTENYDVLLRAPLEYLQTLGNCQWCNGNVHAGTPVWYSCP